MLITLLVTLMSLSACHSQYNGTCGEWCTTIPESSSCDGCDASDCVTIPQSECDPGYWPNAGLINYPKKKKHFWKKINILW